MAGVDELLKRGYIDEKRLGITGGSGGGVLTNWAIGHTTRFVPPSPSATLPTGVTGGTRQTSHNSSRTGSKARRSKIPDFQDAFTDHLYRQSYYAANANSWRGGLAHAYGCWWRTDVSRAEVSEDPDGDGALPQ